MDDDSFVLDDGNVVEEVLNDTLASTSLLESSFSSLVGGPVVASTPRKERVTRKRKRNQGEPPGERIECPECGKTYVNQKTFATHVRMHSMKRASSRVPSKEDVMSISKEYVVEIVKELQSEEIMSHTSQELKRFCGEILECLHDSRADDLVHFIGDGLYDILHNQNAISPGPFRCAVLRAVNTKLNNLGFRNELRNIVNNFLPFAEGTLNVFFGNVYLKLCSKFLVYVFKQMRGEMPMHSGKGKRRSADNINSIEFKQLVFHIGGAVVCGILKKSRRHSSNAVWKLYGEILQSNFMHKEHQSEVSATVSSFTERRDRGGLIFINEEAFDLFQMLFDFLMSLEEDDGSLPTTKILDVVFSNDVILFLWDTLIGSELTEEQSMDLLVLCVKSSTSVVLKGILKRRLNADLSKTYSSVALRSRLAR